MIRVMLFETGQDIPILGDEALITRWQHSADARIWVDLVDNPPQIEYELLCNSFDLHPLAVQDAQRQRHPPKIETFDKYTFLLFKGLSTESKDIEFSTIQLALFIGKRMFITRRSATSPSTDQLWNEVQQNPQQFAQQMDLLALRLCRIMVGRYLNILLELEPKLESAEDLMLTNPGDELLAELTSYKSQLKKLRRIFLYHEQIFKDLRLLQAPGIEAQHIHEINDVYENQERAGSLTNLYYELAADLIDGYISIASHRLNHIMKILTIITAIFVPLGFLAGIYGMNFEHMPELHSRYGYFILLSVMAFVALILLIIFRKRNWL